MYQIGDRLIYGFHGVCRVEGVGPSPFQPKDGKTYYVLTSGASGTKLYTPVDNDKVVMRDLMRPEEIGALIDRMPEILPLTVENEKQRRNLYRETFAPQDPDGYVRIIKTVHARRAEAEKSHRRLPETDNEYDALAKRCLHGEIAAVLHLDPNAVESYLKEQLRAREKEA